jgi:long-chain acyl-CoA synthetase
MSKVQPANEASASPYAARPWLNHYDYWVKPHNNYPCRPLYEILRMATADVPDATATVFFGAQLTFGEIKERTDKFATALVQLGVKQGDRIGVMLPNCPQYLIAAFAVLRLGAIVVNVNPLYTARELAVVATDSGMRALIVLDMLAPVATAVREQTGGQSILETLIVTSVFEYTPAAIPCGKLEGALRLSDMIDGVTEIELPYVKLDPANDVAVLQYTGGTTGTPKGAMLSHQNIFANIVQAEGWVFRPTRRGEHTFLLVIPFFHIYGFTVGMMGGIWHGVRQVLIPKYEVETLLCAIRDYKPTYFPAVPTIYISLLNHPRAREYRLDRVRAFNSGSAPLPVEVIERFETMTGGILCEGYGLSEASPVTHTTASLARRKPGSIGLPIPDTDCKIVDLETGEREVPPGEEGELCIAGPQVMLGYWNHPAETANTLRQDSNGRTWLYTGDVARMDEDGYFYIVQRKKDMIIVSGFNVYPSEVESVLYTHPAVMEAAVIGIPDAYRGEAVKACIVLKQGVTTTVEELKAHCELGLAEFKQPRVIEIRASLPKTAVGKILHRLLREEIKE